MTQREELNADQKELNWLLGLEKETLADMVRQQSKIIKKLQNTAKAQVVPEWWRLVPVEPTKEMFAAGYDELENSESIELIYKRMISASPACGGSSEWVSVFKERPQKIEGNKIWATDGDAQFECEFSDGFWCNISGSEFTHWMPLPPAPEQVKGGE